MKNYYHILGVRSDATSGEIKQSFRKLSLKYHPDKAQNETEKLMYTDIIEAFGVLENESKRNRYDIDQGISAGASAGESARSEVNARSDANANTRSYDPRLLSDPRSQQALVCVDPRQNRQTNAKPQTITHNLNITLEEAFMGCQCPVKIERWIYEDGFKSRENEKMYVEIDEGIDNGEIIVLHEKGNVDAYGIMGDVKIYIHVVEHDVFNRDGLHLIYKKQLSFEEALCGFSFYIPYLSGNSMCIRNLSGEIVLNGSKKVLKGRGIKRNNNVGDMIIIFTIAQPAKLTEEQLSKIKTILFEK